MAGKSKAPTSTRPQTNVRLSKEGRELLYRCADAYGITITDVIEIAVRKYAKEIGVWDVKPSKRRGG